MRTFFPSFLSFTLILAIAFISGAPHLEAAAKKRTVSFEETMSVEDLSATYATANAGGEKVRILIMPGHEPDFGGTQFMGYYEREFVVGIAEQLAKELRTDANFEVFVARGTQGWNDDFEYYFDKQGKKIERFVEKQKEAMEKLEKRGKLEENTSHSAHNAARSDVALRLYGVNKWANENDIDLVLHLHLNDETGHAETERGIHSGVSIYIPERIYGNGKVSRAIAEPIFDRLNTTTATSTFGLEVEGILESRELIAVGAYNTAEPPSLLIEYGYIYEPRITGDGARDEVFADFAHQTALGVKDFFGSAERAPYASRALPFQFTSDVLATTTAANPRAVYALQAALRSLGFYPGTEASLAECPVSGIANECTTLALKAFQAQKGIEQTGLLGPSTRQALNTAFGLSTPVLAEVPQAPVLQAPTPTPGAVCAAFTGELVPDADDTSTKGEVTRLQTLLAKNPTIYPEGKVTGYFGPATLAAVKRFQVQEKIVSASSTAYGIVGPATRAALLKTCSTTAS